MMFIGHLDIDEERGAVNTHRDSYLLDSITVISVRRPFLHGGVLTGVGFAGITAAFGDLLYLHEVTVMIAGATVAIVAGWQVGRLKLLSRDLRGSDLSDVIWGRYARLNVERIRIAGAMNRRKGGRKP